MDTGTLSGLLSEQRAIDDGYAGLRITGNVSIRAHDVVIRNSEIHGHVFNDSSGTRYRFTIEDSTVAAVVLTPFLPAELNDGTPTWAADGRLFLLIEVDAANTQLSGDLSNLEETTQTWSTEVDGVKATARGPLSFGGFRSSGVAVLDVPADARSFTLTASATSIASCASRPHWSRA